MSAWRLSQNQHHRKQSDRQCRRCAQRPDPSPAESPGACARLSPARFENGSVTCRFIGLVLIEDRPGRRWCLALLRFRRRLPLLCAAGVARSCHVLLPLRGAFCNCASIVPALPRCIPCQIAGELPAPIRTEPTIVAGLELCNARGAAPLILKDREQGSLRNVQRGTFWTARLTGVMSPA